LVLAGGACSKNRAGERAIERGSTGNDYTEDLRARYDFDVARVPSTATLRVSAALLAVCAAVWILAAAPQTLGPRDALWIVVHDDCVPDQLHNHNPDPCARVDLDGGVDKGFAILKDISGSEQYLLIPTARISGIESPLILAPDAPNYFAEAWGARTYLDDALHQTLPREDVALAINSAPGRSQDQLHIHIDCVDPDVQAALRGRAASIGIHWAPLDVAFSDHHYWAMWVPGERLGANNPFRLLAEGLPGAAQDMGDRTLVVVGSTRADGTQGFVILEDRVDRAHDDTAHGEELMDHSCRVAASAPPKN
jgi:CDP-diacylglycerol pyrophosphatase